MFGNCLADIVWPSLYVTYYYYASWAVLFGFAAEWAIFHYLVIFSWKRAFLASLVVNSLSAALGFILIPLSGLGWEFTIGSLIQHWGNVGTFNPATWIASWLLAVLVNTAIEYWPLVWPFRAKRSWRLLGIVFAANLASVAFAFIASLFMPFPWM